MKELVFDVEANGLLDSVSNVHCLCIKNLSNSNTISLYEESLSRDLIIDSFKDTTQIIGHNIIGYDIPLIKMMYGIDLIDMLGHEAIVDTYLWSKVLHPDRALPKGCPTSIRNPITNKLKKIGPHSLESWGYRVGEKKIEIHDWRYFDEAMLKRCEIDVTINAKVYYALLKEAGLNG